MSAPAEVKWTDPKIGKVSISQQQGSERREINVFVAEDDIPYEHVVEALLAKILDLADENLRLLIRAENAESQGRP